MRLLPGVSGVPGVTGLSVLRRVEEELRRRREIVTVVTLVKTVRERRGRRETVTLKAVIQVRNQPSNQNFIFQRNVFAGFPRHEYFYLRTHYS